MQGFCKRLDKIHPDDSTKLKKQKKTEEKRGVEFGFNILRI